VDKNKTFSKGIANLKMFFTSNTSAGRRLKHLACNVLRHTPPHNYNIFDFCVSQKSFKTKQEAHNNKGDQI
jgi:hypothetical protein